MMSNTTPALLKPLYGHSSPDTAYVVNDYPYGFRLRCIIRYWIEYNPKKGFRFVSQTTNPKLGGTVWNKPKHSTYAFLAANMYLDTDNHVQWRDVTEYSDGYQVLDFVKNFPNSDFCRLIPWCSKKAICCRGLSVDAVTITVNGKRCEETPEQSAAYSTEAEVWKHCGTLLAKELGARLV